MTTPRRPDEIPGSTVKLGHGARLTPVRFPEWALRVVEGPDSGLSVHLSGTVTRVGKGPENDLTLTDPAVSRTHFTIERHPDGLLLRDLQSTNGTHLNGARTREAFLGADSRLQVGSTIFALVAVTTELPVLAHGADEFHGLVGRSRAMRQLFGYLKTVASTALSVVLIGETGSGKELVARALHSASPRAAGPFVVFDCGSTDPSLVGASLFGHVPGAFTGAVGSRRGAFQAAHRGTLFLDEIGELPLDVQPKLLRALDRREVQPLGSDALVPTDVRLVCATHRDLDGLVASGKFRQDLLFRLAGLTLILPPLRERSEDIDLLAGHFLRQSSPERTLAPDALQVLAAHRWPGNVRELRNVVERAAALAASNTVHAADLLLGPLRPGATSVPVTAELGAAVESLELTVVRKALRDARGNKTEAARTLGIARKTLRHKMEKLGLNDSGDEKS